MAIRDVSPDFQRPAVEGHTQIIIDTEGLGSSER